MDREPNISDVFQRLGQKFRNIAQLSTQVETQEYNQARAIRDLPDDLSTIANDLDRLTSQIRAWREVVTVHQSHSKESREALSTLADVARNAASVFGPSGLNIEILTKTDWQYIKRIIVDSDELATKKALEYMTDEELANWSALIESERGRREK